MRITRPIIAVIAALFCSPAALAATCTSIASGSWALPATWSCAGVPVVTIPGATDTAIIVSPHTVTLVGSIPVTNLTINAGGTLAGAGFTLTISGNLTDNGTISGGGRMNVTGPASVISGAGSFVDSRLYTSGAAPNIAAGAALSFVGNSRIYTGRTAGGANALASVLTINGTINSAVPTATTTFLRLYANSTVIGGTGAVNAATSTFRYYNATATLTNNGSVAVGTVTGNSAAGSVWTNAANSTLNVSASLLATGTLNASAAGNTVNYTGAAQTVKAASSGRYFHLTLSGSGVKTMPPPAMTSLLVGGNFTMAGTASATAADAIRTTGNFTLGAGTAFNNGVYGHNIGGNFTNSGTYTPSTGSINFNGIALQTLTGATTFYRIQVSNNAGLSLANSITVSNMLIFNNGNIVTNANSVITPSNCATSVFRSAISTGHVVGNLRKRIPAGASTCTFEIGSGANYTPVVATFVAGTTAGNITASTTGSDHASIASSGIDPAKSVNRYWTLTNGPAPPVGLPAAGFSATFNFINGSPVDFDTGAVPANFIVQRWNGATWSATTLNATCTATPPVPPSPPPAKLCKQVNGLTAATFGDFAIGEPVSAVVTPGSFNIFETGTAAGAITGRIYTERAGVAFGLDVVAISGGAQLNTFTNTVLVELLGNQAAGVPLDAQNCPTTSTLIQTVTPNPTITGGRSTVSFAAVANAWKDVRVRVRFPVAAPTVTSCSTDNFSIRPSGFTVSSTNAGNTGTSGAPAIKTGAGFNLTAASIVGYNGTPAIDNTAGMVTGTPNQGALGGVFSAAPAATGTATGNTFFYSEAGNFGLNANAVFDDTFTSVDQPGDCTADFSNALVGGRYGCRFGSTAVPLVIGSSGFGRFIPDNFNVGYNTPSFGAACGTFGYVGQVFTYTTAPEITVVARQGTANGLTNATTLNYAGVYMKLTNASLAQAPYDTTAGRYARFDALGGGNTPSLDGSGLPPAASDPAIGTFTNGVGALTFGAGTGLQFTRSITAPTAPFDADVALALNVVDTDGVAFAGTASFGAASAGNGIAFGGGKGMHFGRLKLASAHGSELLNLPVPVQAQYWNGAAFVTNTADNCTTLAANNIQLAAPPAGVGVAAGITLSSGAGALILTKPATPAKVSVDVCVDLVTDAACAAVSSANLPHLQGLWPPGTNYNNDPAARATFGVYKGSNEFIYLRENY
ncbi:MAG: hypothetical protein FD134_1477 [Gallionellaceae bacterium]|nr:MAG: hypothetical protein FD134_1477 [Gallionellaceae bacterium]